jgi:group II intron reverse transcriptase/maturase
MLGTPSPHSVITKQQRIAELARKAPDMAFTNLAHHIDIDWLRTAYEGVRKDGAVGSAGQTPEGYAENLEENLHSLLNRFKSGDYRAPAVDRVYIRKRDGGQRPIGIPTFEDKVLQRAVTLVLEPIYEQDFYDCSYGYRPKRTAHEALNALTGWLYRQGGGWVLEVDIRGFFNHLDHAVLRAFLDQRVRDGVVRRVIGKWLKAGAFKEAGVRRSNKGTPQGGVISPLLANIYLHEVIDRWFHEEIRPRLADEAMLVRFADDMVFAFRSEADARRVFEVLPKRLNRYQLSLHPEKTRLLRFYPPVEERTLPEGPIRRETFDFLGFTIHWDRSRRTKAWIPKKRTAKDRLKRALCELSDWCRRHRHRKVREQHRHLCPKIQGHYSYYGVTGNWDQIARFFHGARRIWRKWLHRRSQRRGMPWPRFERLSKAYPLPAPRIVHSYVVKPCV